MTRLALAKGENKKAYIHCTAGLGRAPGTLLAYMYWVKGIPLETAYEMLYSVRRYEYVHPLSAAPSMRTLCSS